MIPWRQAITIYTEQPRADRWVQDQVGICPLVACVLGFTETGLIPGISAAGATPDDRRYTALADAEFLWHGAQPHPTYALPPLTAGVSPAVISRAIITALDLPLQLFNAGLPHRPTVPCVELGRKPAQCLTTGRAMPYATAQSLFHHGLEWGKTLATLAAPGMVVIAECVVGGTTTALSVLTGLGVAAAGKVNSSHTQCNHGQKMQLVDKGLAQAMLQHPMDPLALVAAVGDPMQPVVAGMAIAASLSTGVLLAGGTQMLAVYALAASIAAGQGLSWHPDRIAVGTTRWVVEDPSGDTIGLAHAFGQIKPAIPLPILLGTRLNFASSGYAQLRAYEQGFVKEGVGAGGCAIAASLYRHWQSEDILQEIEALLVTLGLVPDRA